jgi:hypothetical protein
MATWTDQVYDEVKVKRDNFVTNGYDEAKTTFLNNSIDSCSFRDISWDAGASQFTIIETGQQHSTWSPDQQLKYFPQLIQLIVIGSEQVLYP